MQLHVLKYIYRETCTEWNQTILFKDIHLHQIKDTYETVQFKIELKQVLLIPAFEWISKCMYLQINTPFS
jgi:hypothetical protein